MNANNLGEKKSLKLLPEEIFEGRKEVRGLTIDGPRSLDLDDAIWLEKNGDDYIVHVSITDLSIVKIDSYEDKNALRQGYTHYFSTGNRPLFPRKLSEKYLSLLEKKKRPTLTVSIPINENIEIGEAKIEQTFIRSYKKLSYEQAEKLMDSDDDPFLAEAYHLSKKLFEKRRAEGALVYYDKNNDFTTDEEGNIIILTEERKYNSHILIQEFMILANQAVAQFFVKNDITGLFRNHRAKRLAPDRNDLLIDLENTLAEGNYNRINTFRNKLNLILERALYEPTVSGHYGLNLPVYLHFTSPIRRYADLVNHRQLVAFLGGPRIAL